MAAKTMTYLATILDNLDSAARANLGPRGVQSYELHKALLLEQDKSPYEIEAILTGFIWDESEVGISP